MAAASRHWNARNCSSLSVARSFGHLPVTRAVLIAHDTLHGGAILPKALRQVWQLQSTPRPESDTNNTCQPTVTAGGSGRRAAAPPSPRQNRPRSVAHSYRRLAQRRAAPVVLSEATQLVEGVAVLLAALQQPLVQRDGGRSTREVLAVALTPGAIFQALRIFCETSACLRMQGIGVRRTVATVDGRLWGRFELGHATAFRWSCIRLHMAAAGADMQRGCISPITQYISELNTIIANYMHPCCRICSQALEVQVRCIDGPPRSTKRDPLAAADALPAEPLSFRLRVAQSTQDPRPDSAPTGGAPDSDPSDPPARVMRVARGSAAAAVAAAVRRASQEHCSLELQASGYAACVAAVAALARAGGGGHTVGGRPGAPAAEAAAGTVAAPPRIGGEGVNAAAGSYASGAGADRSKDDGATDAWQSSARAAAAAAASSSGGGGSGGGSSTAAHTGNSNTGDSGRGRHGSRVGSSGGGSRDDGIWFTPSMGLETQADGRQNVVIHVAFRGAEAACRVFE